MKFGYSFALVAPIATLALGACKGDDASTGTSASARATDWSGSAEVSTYAEFAAALEAAAALPEGDAGVDELDPFRIVVTASIDDGFADHGALEYEGQVDLHIVGEGDEPPTIDAGGHSPILVDGTSHSTDAGAVYLENLRFIGGKESDSLSGAGAIDGLRVTVQSSHFENNVTSGLGGAISDAVAIRDSTFERNRSERRGGAVVLAEDGAVIEGSTFRGNYAERNGGAVLVRAGISAEIRDSTFADNTVDHTRSMGGAISASDGLTIEGSTFESNRAQLWAGAIFLGPDNRASDRRSRPLVIRDSRFVGNEGERSSSRGGAIYANAHCDSDAGDEITFEDTTFEGNRAGTGAVLYSECDAGEVQITRSTFSDNDDPVLRLSSDVRLVDGGDNRFEGDEPPDWTP